MTKCYEFWVLEFFVRDINRGVPGEFSDAGVSIALPDEAEEILEKILEPLDTTVLGFTWRTEATLREQGINPPWALIAFDREYRLAGHLCHIRGDRSKMTFTSYSVEADHSVEEDGVPPVSVIYVMQKKVLKDAAQKSLFLKSAWEALADKPEDKHYICFPDPAPPGWVTETERGDDDLFLRYLRGLR